MKKILSVLVPSLLVLLSVVACAAQPVAISDVPVYPGAEPLEPEENSLAGKVLEAMKASAEEQGLSARLDFYTLPDDATWEDVVVFYDGELAGTDWKPAPDLDSESATFKGTGWSRGSGNNEQSLVVNYVSEIPTEGSFLLVGLFSR
jgi:hypothetical protein